MATSKPPSGSRRASSKRQLPELFCDRSLGRIKVPSRLRAVHPVVIAHDDVFPQDTDDEVWLAEAGKRGWVVLMKDDRIRYRPWRTDGRAESGCPVLLPPSFEGRHRGPDGRRLHHSAAGHAGHRRDIASRRIYQGDQSQGSGASSLPVTAAIDHRRPTILGSTSPISPRRTASARSSRGVSPSFTITRRAPLRCASAASNAAMPRGCTNEGG